MSDARFTVAILYFPARTKFGQVKEGVLKREDQQCFRRLCCLFRLSASCILRLFYPLCLFHLFCLLLGSCKLRLRGAPVGPFGSATGLCCHRLRARIHHRNTTDHCLTRTGYSRMSLNLHHPTNTFHFVETSSSFFCFSFVFPYCWWCGRPTMTGRPVRAQGIKVDRKAHHRCSAAAMALRAACSEIENKRSHTHQHFSSPCLPKSSLQKVIWQI